MMDWIESTVILTAPECYIEHPNIGGMGRAYANKLLTYPNRFK